MTEPHSVADYFSLLEPDPWRSLVGFSPEVEVANQELFRPGVNDPAATQILGSWLERHQPCLFGRIAARSGAITYCFLTERDLQGTDESIKDKIQLKRLEWTRAGFEGRKSGFVILAVSSALTTAQPGPALLGFARRLCYLYLETDIETDKVHMDQIFLQKPGSRLTTWKWFTGVNYFSASGDKRWWHDHRIPGGMAFSVNSVGHLVKSGIVAKGMRDLDEDTGAPFEEYPETKVDSLGKALELAMRTIDMAADTISGRATELLPLPSDRNLRVPSCPVQLSTKVADKNYCEYTGHYHTDFTLPSEYFLPAIERPPTLPAHTLDFTYLFHPGVDNPDFRLLGEGHRIRSIAPDAFAFHSLADWEASRLKEARAAAEEVDIAGNQRLVAALNS